MQPTWISLRSNRRPHASDCFWLAQSLNACRLRLAAMNRKPGMARIQPGASRRHAVRRLAWIGLALNALLTSCARYDAVGAYAILSLIRFDPTSIPARIGSVQTGQVAMTATTRTASVTAVDLTRSFIFCNYRTDSSNMNNVPTCQLSASDQVTVQGGVNANFIVRYFVIEFASGARVQRGALQLPVGTSSATANFEAVNTLRSFPIVYSRSASTTQVLDEERSVGASLAVAGDSITVSRSSATTVSTDVEWQVIEFGGATVQAGVLNIGAGQTSTTAAINAVNLERAWVNVYVRPNNISGREDQYYVRGGYNSATEVGFSRFSALNSVDVFYYAVEAPESVRVQRGVATTTPAPNTENIIDVTLPTAVNENLAWPIISAAVTGGGTADQDSGNWSARFLSSNGLRLQRGSPQDVQSDIDWTVVEFVP